MLNLMLLFLLITIKQLELELDKWVD